MTLQEFNNTFDVYYNNIASNRAPGLDAYEKSVLLTRAEEELVKNYFNPQGNKYKEGFDDSAKRQADFASLIYTTTLNKIEGKSPYFGQFFYRYPKDVFVVLNEEYKELNENLVKTYTIIPISYAEYERLMQKPYKYPLKNQIWRLITRIDDYKEAPEGVAGNPSTEFVGNNDSIIELRGRFGVNGYYNMRYVRRPKPIILEDIDDTEGSTGLRIHNEWKARECELPEHLHEEIVQRAVELAKMAWVGEPTTAIQMGERVE